MIETFLAALVAVTLQCGLIIIAAVTTFHGGVRVAVGVIPEPYGFPCYAAGATFLSFGMAICSLTIEQSTGEFSWEVAEDKPPPQLFFLQPSQRVQVSTLYDPTILPLFHFCMPVSCIYLSFPSHFALRLTIHMGYEI